MQPGAFLVHHLYPPSLLSSAGFHISDTTGPYQICRAFSQPVVTTFASTQLYFKNFVLIICIALQMERW